MPAKEENSRREKEDLDADVLDTMITSLVELLEEKGIITQEEWEQKIKNEPEGIDTWGRKRIADS